MRACRGGGRGEQGRMPMTSFTRVRVQAHAPPHYLLPPLPYCAHANGSHGRCLVAFGEKLVASYIHLNKGSTPREPLLSKNFEGFEASYQVTGVDSSGSRTNEGGSSSSALAPTPRRVPFPPQSSAQAARAAARAAATAAEDYNPDAGHSSSSSSAR